MSSPPVIPCQRELFDLPPEVTYLNCGYMSPLMHRVAEAGEAAVRRKQRPWTITPPDFFQLPDRGRALFAELVSADRDGIAICPSVSYGMAVAALNIDLDPGQEILLLEDQFPSNVYPWIEKAERCNGRLVTVPRPPKGHAWTPLIVDAIGERTAVVAVPHCHWTDGSLVDLEAVGAAARDAGAALVVDATQSVGALPFDVQSLKPDFLVVAAYKWMLGPYSLGFLYVSPRYREGRALEESWANRRGASDFARLVDYQPAYGPGAKRMDMGESTQFHLMPMAITAMEQILDWGVPRIAATLALKTADIAQRAKSLGLESVPPDLRAGHFLGLRFPGGVPDGMLQRLAERDIYVSVRGDSVRVTPHLFNNDQDADRLLEALAAEVAQGSIFLE